MTQTSETRIASDFRRDILDRAKELRRTILFPEYQDTRVSEAIDFLNREGIVNAVSLGDMRDKRHVESITEMLLAARTLKGATEESARELAQDSLVYADGLVALGEAHGCVAGAVHTTAQVIRSALWTIGLAPGIRRLSSSFYMIVPSFRGNGEEVLTFTDCAVVSDPNSRQLAEIAVTAAVDRERIVGDKPIVAFLSFSTYGSADSLSVKKVREAVSMVKESHPHLLFDGELQADAALVESVGGRKAPGSEVAGRANVLVFPSLDSANISYKLVERLGGAQAIGPILQGLARPANDLSRGASMDDIVLVAAITALQSVEQVELPTRIENSEI